MLTLENIHYTVRGVKEEVLRSNPRTSCIQMRYKLFTGKHWNTVRDFIQNLHVKQEVRMTVAINTSLCINLFTDYDLSILEH